PLAPIGETFHQRREAVRVADGLEQPSVRGVGGRRDVEAVMREPLADTGGSLAGALGRFTFEVAPEISQRTSVDLLECSRSGKRQTPCCFVRQLRERPGAVAVGEILVK